MRKRIQIQWIGNRHMGTRCPWGKMAYMGKGLLCEECAKKFDMVKDRLKYEEDFFTMTDDDFSLMEYDFKVGDKVVTSRGEVGVIRKICDCTYCEKRGFYEPYVTTTAGTCDIYITDGDKRRSFNNFYQIGKYTFGNIDINSVKKDIEFEQNNIEKATKNIEEYRNQLARLYLLQSSNENEKID